MAKTPKEHYDEYAKEVAAKRKELDKAKGATRQTSGPFRFSRNSAAIDIFNTTDVLLLQNIKLLIDSFKGDWWLESDQKKWQEDVNNSLVKLTYSDEIKKNEQKMKDLTELLDDPDKKAIKLEQILNS